MRWLKSLRGAARAGPADPLPPPAAETAPADVREAIAALLAGGDARAAHAAAQAAADRYPADAEINALCGQACLAAGDAEGALDAFYLAAHYDPANERAVDGRVAALRQLGRTGEIAGAFEELLAARPDHPGALRALARIAVEGGDFDRAAALLEQALARHPDDADVLNDLGLLVARESADFARGEALLRRALAAAPQASHVRINLGWVLCERRAYGDGFRLLDEALAAAPHDQEARLIRSLCRLKRGDFAAGWDEYDVRHASPTARRRPFSFPAWDGAPLAADRLLVYAEQGLGDQIMFASCLPDALARAPDCIVECEPRLYALFARSFPGARVVSGPLRETAPDWLFAAGPIGRQIALGSLPRFFRRSAYDFPAHAGYLRADPDRASAWRERLASLGPAPKIGLSWRGGAVTSRRGLRSLDLARLAGVFAGVRAEWISLQYGDCRAELASFARDHGITVHHWQTAIEDYDETAALVTALDAVVSVCTAVVHLAGSLGRPATVLVPYGAEWRYGAEGPAMPWYPSVRLLRQRAPGDWDAVLDDLRRELLTGPPAAA